ncbi:MAG: DsbA family protein [Rudanella sp.]|nr:DsbA family protein [Rudanella sp.]
MRTILALQRTPHPLDLIEYGDFSCPRCQELQELLTTTLPLFAGEVCYTFRYFPSLSQPKALLMALAAEAARRQHTFWAMHQALFDHTPMTSISLTSVTALASRLGLEPELFLNDMRDETLKHQIWSDMERGRLAGVVSTPALFLGFRHLHGKLTQARLLPLIRHYVERSKADVLSTIDPEHGLVRWSGIGYQ